MRILSVFTLFLIRTFKITNRELGYRYLMLIVSLLISTFGLFAFGIKAFSTYSYHLAYVLMLSVFLNLTNLILLKQKSNFQFSSYFFIFTFLLTMAYLVFDSGRGGYGYLWFFAIPVVNISILGVGMGTLFSFGFLLYLSAMFLIPSYYIDVDFLLELKPRLLISFFTLIILILFREWTVEFFKKKRRDENEILEINLKHKRTAILKLSNQIRYVTNEILSSTKAIKKHHPKSQVLKPLDDIRDSSLNLINIINSIGEFSEIDIKDDEAEEYNLQTELEHTINLFSSYKIDININIDKDIPPVFYGNSLIIKQLIYNIIENFVSNSEQVNMIDIDVFKGSESWDSTEIKYQVVNLLVDRKTYKQNPPNCRYVEFLPTDNNAQELDKIGLKSIISLIAALNGNFNLNKTKYFSSICFNQQLANNSTAQNPSSDTYSDDFEIETKIRDNLANKKLSKMRVLLMEDNPMTQKTITFTLDKMVKKLDIASNGKEGLEMFNTNKYDLILLDMNMPIVDGYEVARKIRKIEQGLKLHILIIAVISDFLSKDVDKIMVSGVDFHIHKPLTVGDLTNKINLFSKRYKNQ